MELYKIKGALKKNKANFVVYLVLLIVAILAFIAPISYSIVLASESGVFDFGKCLENIVPSMQKPFETLGNALKGDNIAVFGKTFFYFWIFYSAFFIVGVVRSAPKNEYTDIEHGSGDWSKNGEQYKILSRDSGIILAEDNYLPLDKRGNTNVLVVGRFRIW